jgi:alpha-beta hydrolase superfamily lysophospholipase
VTRYLSDELVRAQAQHRVLRVVADDTRIIIGHSLGSVVAYESARRLSTPLSLLLTLGSPLGLRTIVTDRLRPPPSFPSHVRRWVNAAADDDIDAAEPDLRSLFTHDMPDSSDFTSIRVDNGSDPHDPAHYLGKIAVGRVIAEALG